MPNEFTHYLTMLDEAEKDRDLYREAIKATVESLKKLRNGLPVDANVMLRQLEDLIRD